MYSLIGIEYNFKTINSLSGIPFVNQIAESVKAISKLINKCFP